MTFPRFPRIMGAVPGHHATELPRGGAEDRGSVMTTTPSPRRWSLVLGATSALLLAGLVLAGPAAAIADPRRPAATLTHGPSCGPGDIRVRVVNGTEAHRVALVFDGTGEQDSAVLGPDGAAELRSADVDWGTTVDVSLTVGSADGTTVDEPVRFGTYTRPTRADCDLANGSSREMPPVVASSEAAAAAGDDTPGGDAGPGGRASSPSVAPGGVVTLRGAGYTPGEYVQVSVPGAGDPLTTVRAGADGTVEAVVQIPRSTGLGTLTVQLVGQKSDTTTGLDLQVAPRAPSVASAATRTPVVAAGSALLAAGAGLGLLAARRPRGDADGLPARR